MFVLVCWSVVGQHCVCVELLVSCGTVLCLCWFVRDNVVCVGLWDMVVFVLVC